MGQGGDLVLPLPAFFVQYESSVEMSYMMR